MQHAYARPSSCGHQYSFQSICCTTYSVFKMSILTTVEINSSYSNALPSDVRTIQTNTCCTCVLIPDQSDTWINARGAYNLSHDALVDLYKHNKIKYWLNTITPYCQVSTPAKLAFNSHRQLLQPVTNISLAIFQLQINSISSSSIMFNSSWLSLDLMHSLRPCSSPALHQYFKLFWCNWPQNGNLCLWLSLD